MNYNAKYNKRKFYLNKKIRGNNIKKMLSVIRDKILDWQTERAEKQAAQLRRKNEKLAHYMAEAVHGNSSEIVPNQQGLDSKTKTQQEKTNTKEDRYRKPYTK